MVPICAPNWALCVTELGSAHDEQFLQKTDLSVIPLYLANPSRVCSIIYNEDHPDSRFLFPAEDSMGQLLYGSPPIIVEFDDRVLAHLEMVMIAKLRRDESFSLSWEDERPSVGSRNTIWINPAIPLHFLFFGSKRPVINRTWLEALMNGANSGTGLRVMHEPADPALMAAY